MVIHHPYHFQFPDNVLPLPSLIKKHQKANPDSDQSVIHDCDQQTACVLLQPDIRQTSKKKMAKPVRMLRSGATQREPVTGVAMVGILPTIPLAASK